VEGDRETRDIGESKKGREMWVWWWCVCVYYNIYKCIFCDFFVFEQYGREKSPLSLSLFLGVYIYIAILCAACVVEPYISHTYFIKLFYLVHSIHLKQFV